MNYGSEEQKRAVAQSCNHFDSGGTINSTTSVAAANITCDLCKNWDGRRCVINAFDNVLTSLDQT